MVSKGLPRGNAAIPEDVPGRRPRGRPSRRGARIEAALEAAAIVLNESGLTNASLDGVAERLGVTKSALYYYFSSKEEVVFQSYLRTCRLAAGYAVEAARGPGSGRSRLTHYLKLHFSAPPVAFLSDIAVLTPEHEREVRRLAHQHDDLLSGILADGHADGSLFVLRPQLTTFAVTGALNWVFVWFQARAGYLSRPQVGEIFTDVFLHGLLRPGAAMTQWPAPVVIETPSVESAFDRTFQAAQRRDYLLRTASGFFNHRGFDNASFDEIAAALEISRSALYHYVDNKEELLFECYLRSIDLTEQVIGRNNALGGAAEDLEARFIASMIHLNAGPRGPLAGYFRLQSLTPEHQEIVRIRSQKAIGEAAYSERGMTEGVYRPVNAALSRRAIMGAINWLPRWYAPSGLNSPAEVADAFCSLFLSGLIPRA
jgi:AcrR family transcriptional regulator